MGQAASISAMATAIEKALKPAVEGYTAQTPEADSKVKADIKKLEDALEICGATTPTGKALAKKIARLAPDPAELKRQRLAEVAEAVVIACNNLRLPVQLKKMKPAKGSAAASGGRMTKADMEATCKVIMGALPPKSGKYIGKAEIASKTKIDPARVNAALQKLKRDGEAANNGVRGQAAGWRKAG